MQPHRSWTRCLVLFTIVSLLIVPLTATAAHNSAGWNAYIVQADETDGQGNLVPDVPHETSPYVTTFHDNLDTPRVAPPDQTGDRYTDCATWGSFGGVQGDYEQALLDGTACYVGFLDAQWEYFVYWNILFYPKQSSDDLYFLNPEPGDSHCEGDGDLATRVDRALNDPSCSGSGHTWYVPGDLAIDTDLFEAGFQGEAGSGSIGATDLTGVDPGSGTNVLPLDITPYVFLFGQPHPTNEDPSPVQAGQGVFGPSPADGGGPLFDLTGVCGERTDQCRLLTPQDLLAYDTNHDNLGDVGGFGEQARLCVYRPQFITVNPDARDAGLCGVYGSVINSFFPTTTEGGFGMPGAPDTFVNVIPGWYEATIMTTYGEVFNAVDAAEEPTQDGSFDTAIYQYVAVNPKVPTDTSPLWCIRPNFLAAGGSFGGQPDPGVYGAYVADAIDSDAYTSPFKAQYDTVIGALHPTVKPLYDTADGALDDASGTVEDVTDDLSLPPEVAGPVNTAADRADMQESSDPGVVGTAFTVTQEAGLACDAQGVVRFFDAQRVLDGGVQQDLDVFVSRPGTGTDGAVELKDPTLFDEGGLPAGESETTQGAWHTDFYTFSGDVVGFLDTSQDADQEAGAQFSGCASANGQPQPNNDFCSWQPLWDAYNPECTTITGDSCETVLDGRGYDTDAGVGLYFVLKLTGPALVVDEDLARTAEVEARSALLGTDDATAQNCVVGVSRGFGDKLPALLSNRTGSALGSMDDVVDRLCQGATGESLLVLDAFDDQSAVGSPGQYSAAVRWARVLPTPDALEQATGLGVGDELCIEALWHVQADRIADDTTGSLELSGADSPHAWGHCFQMQPTVR